MELRACCSSFRFFKLLPLFCCVLPTFIFVRPYVFVSGSRPLFPPCVLGFSSLAFVPLGLASVFIPRFFVPSSYFCFFVLLCLYPALPFKRPESLKKPLPPRTRSWSMMEIIVIRRMEIIGTSSEKMKTGDHVSIDIYKLGKTMREELEILHPSLDDCCIYRVPKRLRVLNEKAYTPQVVSIGPLHHGREELKAMEECKRRYLKDFLAWSELSLEDLIGVTEMEETRLRNCYAEAIELSSDVFVKMMLLDAAFIIMIMLKNYFLDFQSSNDRIFSRPWMIHDIRFDMILLENQLPFFFLNDLLKLSKPYKGYSLIEFTHGFLKGALGSWVTDNILNGINSSEVQHFVDFLRICQQPTKLPQPRKLKTLNMPSAAELRQAGVKFKLGSSKNLFDVKFNKSRGRLEIPRLLVIDQTEILFRNLQAFEQCNCSDKYVTNYITMINLLVCSTRDVEMNYRKLAA